MRKIIKQKNYLLHLEERLKDILLQILALMIFISWLSACVPVASYQKMYLNDDEMSLKERVVELGEINALSYREGAAGAIGGKSGGGCGCN